jgi:TonB-dependent receptor
MYIRSFALICILLLSLQKGFTQSGTIRGNVSDQVSHDPLSGAYVSLANTSYKTAADAKGNFELRGVPAGEYELIVTTVGYTEVRRHISLKAGEIKKVQLGMNPSGKSLQEVTVFGKADRENEAGSRDKEKNAPNVMNVISSEAMVRSPDINAANVLQRVSGVTISRVSGGDEAYAIVRGMEPRYNNTLINGIKIASPDNKNRFVQLDIIPSDILSSIEISKSLTPDMEGDAIGGTVNMVVKDAPEITSFKATASVGYDQLFFDEKYITFKKGDIQPLSPIQRNPLGYVAQPGDFSRSNLDFEPVQAPPTGTLGFSYTQRFYKDKIGFVLADNVQNQYYGNISTRSTVTPISITSDTMRLNDETAYKGYTQQLNNGLTAHVDYVFNERNKVNIDNVYIYSYEAQARLSYDTTLLGTGRVGPGTGQVFPAQNSFTQFQHIENVKVSGKHVLPAGFTFDWAGVYSEAGRRDPDLATINTDFLIKYDFSKTGTLFDDITRSWLRNDDKDYTGIANLDYRHQLGNTSVELKAGGLYNSKSRFNSEDDYTLRPPAQDSNGNYLAKPLWIGIYNQPWIVFNSAGTNVYNPNNYHATETISAEYGMIRLKGPGWEAGGGLRIEHTQDNWNVKVHSTTAPNSGQQNYTDFLPSVFAKIQLTDKQALHASYFRSISRPNYYELVPGQTFGGDYYVQGNPYLLHSVADNADLRYEWFPKGEEHLFVGVFYKYIVDPIEQGLTGASNGVLYLQPDTSQPATNYGAEASFTQYWGKFGVTGNYTYVHSNIKAYVIKEGIPNQREDRPMQGQTDHVVNVSLLYKDTKHGFFAQLAYQYLGTTLVQINSLEYGADYYQRPQNFLSFSLEKDIRKHFTVFGKFNNLLNTPSVQYVDKTLEVSRDVYKATYQIGIRYDAH